jgi:hypothetical protein
MTKHDAAILRFSQWWLRAVRGGYGFAEVSLLHRRQSEIYKRETARAIFWGGLLPSAMLIGAATLHPGIAMGLLIYVIQICRIAVVRGWAAFSSWIYASFMIIAKFAEFQGVLKFIWYRWVRRTIQNIEYKGHFPLPK